MLDAILGCVITGFPVTYFNFAILIVLLIEVRELKRRTGQLEAKLDRHIERNEGGEL